MKKDIYKFALRFSMTRHTSFFSCFISTLILMIPGVFLYAYDYSALMLIYNGIILFSTLKGFSNRLWIAEIDKELWDKKFRFLQPQIKTNIKSTHK